MSTLLDARRPMINTEVIDSPACAMPQYADYRRRYYLVTGSHGLTSADTLPEMLEAAKAWSGRSARIVRVPVVPFYDVRETPYSSGRPVGRPASAGGNWGGRCGSGIWVADTDKSYQRAYRTLHALDASTVMQDSTQGYEVSLTQAWWINGISDRHPEQDGFWVECQQKYRHLGLCTALDLDWDWRDYAPWTDQVHNTQLSLFD